MKRSSKVRKIVYGVAALLLVAVGTAGAMAWPDLPEAKVAGNPGLKFHDEFSGERLDRTKWVTCYNNYSNKYKGCTNYGNWESEWYMPSQVHVAHGTLLLTATKKEVRGDNKFGQEQAYPYVSGMVSSGSLDLKSPPKWSTTYGYFEARMMTPYGQAIWPAFWLLPIDASWPPEIDIMETLGHKPNEILHTYFWKGGKGEAAKDSAVYDYGTNLSNDWHVYGMDWQPGSIRWYLDGKLVRQIASDNVSTEPMHIVLNLAVGGSLPGYPDNTTPTASRMIIDYVRVYDSKESADND